MPAYYFHLAFELSSKRPGPETQHYLPQPGTSLFDKLPEHNTISWGTQLDQLGARPSHKRSSTEPESTRLKPVRQASHPAKSELPNVGRLRLGSTGPEGAPKGTGPETKDWRVDAVSIISIDMEQEQGNSRGKLLAEVKPSDALNAGGVPIRGVYVPSEPKNTELGWGVVHLYREVDETPGLYEEDNTPKFTSSSGQESFEVEDCTTLCILAVPSYMTPSDLLGYVGEGTREDVSHFRLIRTGRANKYMVLMKFRDAKKARTWQKEWNGKPFNSMEPEYCHVVFIKSVNFQTPSSTNPSSFPNMTNDPFLPAAQPSSATAESPIATSLSTKPFAPRTPALIELPTCPVCLERMDESTGLLIILCQHVFHCACLEKWRGSGCPVCRYTQNSPHPGLGRGLSALDAGDSVCSVCAAEQNLWICLICGNVGCGRYDSAHAFAHYEESHHSYAMDIATQHVWDYAGDGYVHRLIQNKADGKLMDMPAAASSWSDKAKGGAYGAGVDGGMAAFGADMVPREKMEAMGNEYSYMLTSQLDSQRAYYEEQLDRAVTKASKAGATAESAAAKVDALADELAVLTARYGEAQSGLAELERELERARKRADKSDGLARQLGKDWKEEKTVNESLLERIKFMEGQMREEEARRVKAEEEKRDLEEQNRDLSFFISGTERLKEVGEEVVEGTVEVGAAPEAKGKKKRKGKK